MPRIQLTKIQSCCLLTSIAMAALCAWPVPSAHAVTTNWNVSSSGDFTAAGNWDNGVPDSDDTAVFNRGFLAYEVNFPGGSIFEPPPNYVIDFLRVRTNEVSFVYNAPPFNEALPMMTVANAGESIFVGENAGDVAILNMAISRLSGTSAYIGRAAGAVGTLNVGGRFSMSSVLDVGRSGAGTLNVINGGRVESISGTVGRLVGSMGVATVSGAGSNWTVNTVGGIQGGLDVGSLGTGELNIIGGGAVTCRLASIGFQGQGTVAVTGAGSTWSISQLLSLGSGSGGSGMLTIDDGAAVSSGGSLIASNSAGTGEVVVTGAGSTWTVNGRIGLGGNWIINESGGPGTLSIEPGATVTNGFNEIVIFPQGVLNLQGGTLDVGQVSFSQGVGQFNFTAGRLRIASYAGNLLNPGGTLVARGITNVSGSYTQQSAAKLEISIAGTNVGTQYSRLASTGGVSLDGALEVLLTNGFLPSAGQSFDILNWGSLSGTFFSVLLPGLNSGLSWDTSQLYTTGVLSVVSAPTFSADFDNDGDVDGDDLAQWQGDFGVNALSDADDDGDSDGADFLQWQRQLGSGLPATGASAAVPEPGAAWLAALAFVTLRTLFW